MSIIGSTVIFAYYFMYSSLRYFRFWLFIENKPTYPCHRQFACHLMIDSRSSRRITEKYVAIPQTKMKLEKPKNLYSDYSDKTTTFEII